MILWLYRVHGVEDSTPWLCSKAPNPKSWKPKQPADSEAGWRLDSQGQGALQTIPYPLCTITLARETSTSQHRQRKTGNGDWGSGGGVEGEGMEKKVRDGGGKRGERKNKVIEKSLTLPKTQRITHSHYLHAQLARADRA